MFPSFLQFCEFLPERLRLRIPPSKISPGTLFGIPPEVPLRTFSGVTSGIPAAFFLRLVSRERFQSDMPELLKESMKAY